jgi:putative ubiquitin-RnfH superfamily antitoxin RatB of RatAB toxin-antitoxin module
MRVELAWIGPAGAVVREFEVAAGASVGEVLELAARDPGFAGAPLAAGAVGVFGRLVTPAQPLADGDRIELYRGPAVDPKLARRARARSR